MAKQTLTAKVSPKNMERLEKYADREGISKSEATDRLVKQGLDVEESDMRLVPVKSDGGTRIEEQLSETQDQVSQLNNELDKLVLGLRGMAPAWVAALVWIGLQSSFGIPGGPIVTVLSGIGVCIWLVLSYFRVTGGDDDE